jgi:hypothetical protein
VLYLRTLGVSVDDTKTFHKNFLEPSLNFDSNHLGLNTAIADLLSIVAERRRNNRLLLIRPADVMRCNPKALAEIALGVMQLLNDSCFHVTTETNQLASGTGRAFRALTCLLQSDFHVQIRGPAGIEMPVLVNSIFLLALV